MCSIIISVVAAMCKQQSLLKVKDICYVIFRHSEVFHTLPVFFYILDIIYVYIKYIGMRIYYIYIYILYIFYIYIYIYIYIYRYEVIYPRVTQDLMVET